MPDPPETVPLPRDAASNGSASLGTDAAPGRGARALDRPVRSPLPVRDAYRLWADGYETETAVSALEDRVVRARTPVPLTGDLLDAGCGTGRRLLGLDGPDRIAGVDLVPEMLLAGRRRDPSRRVLAAADLRALPFAEGTFDRVWCRLVLGHLEHLESAYDEFRRVTRGSAELLVTDFHPAATKAGHTRTFRDAAGRLHVVEHHLHSVESHVDAASRVGWSLTERVDACPGEEERPFYARAGRPEQFNRERNLPLVLLMCFRR